MKTLLTKVLVLLLVISVPQSAFAGPRADDGDSRSSSGSSSPGETLKGGLRAEAQTERNRGNDAEANRLDNMADRVNTRNISDAEASDISREVANGNFDRADSLVDRSSRD